MPRTQPQFSSSLFREDLEHVFARTRDFWEEIRGQRLFITGGTGFFGTWLVESFLWANEQLRLNAQAVVLSRDPQAFLRKMPHLASLPTLSFHVGDARSFEFPNGRFSHVIHAVNQTADDAANPATMLDVIVNGTRHTLDFARQCGVQKLLFTSSGSVYGPQPADLAQVSEDYSAPLETMDPRFAHAQGKRFAEHLCAVYDQHYGIEAKITRGFAFVGPYLPLNANYAVGNFLRDGLNGGPVVVHGDGTPNRSYLYATDLTVWLWTILFRGQRCRPYNVGSMEAVSIADLAHRVAAAFSPSPAVAIAKAPIPGKPADRYVPDCQRAAEELGLRQEVTLTESIRRTRRWLEANVRHASSHSMAHPDLRTSHSGLPINSGSGIPHTPVATPASAPPIMTTFAKEVCNG